MDKEIDKLFNLFETGNHFQFFGQSIYVIGYKLNGNGLNASYEFNLSNGSKIVINNVTPRKQTSVAVDLFLVSSMD